MSNEEEVREASRQFYAALNQMLRGDAGPMGEAWSLGDDVTTMHPLGGREIGREKVRKSWAQVASLATGGHVELRGQHLQVGGDLACETGEEHGHGEFGKHQVQLDHRVTNVYRREGGVWKVVHHHADPSPAMIELVRTLAE